MGTTKAKRHIHKYHQIKFNGVPVWACALPTCNHHIPPHMSEMVPGKASICWNCGEQLILGPENMNMVQPICHECMAIRMVVGQ